MSWNQSQKFINVHRSQENMVSYHAKNMPLSKMKNILISTVYLVVEW